MATEMVTVCISNYNRPHYARRSVISLKERWSGDVLIVDDCSTEQCFTELKSLVPEKWQLCRNQKNLGITAVIRSLLEHCNSRYLYITDNDVIYSADFTAKLEEAVRHEFRAASLFFSSERNAVSNPLLATIPDLLTIKHKQIGEWQMVPSFGGISALIERNLFSQFCEYLDQVGDEELYKNCGGWDWIFSYFCLKNNIEMFQTGRSLVRHIGSEGLNSHLGKFDTAHEYPYSLAETVLTVENKNSEGVTVDDSLLPFEKTLPACKTDQPLMVAGIKRATKLLQKGCYKPIIIHPDLKHCYKETLEKFCTLKRQYSNAQIFITRPSCQPTSTRLSKLMPISIEYAHFISNDIKIPTTCTGIFLKLLNGIMSHS